MSKKIKKGYKPTPEHGIFFNEDFFDYRKRSYLAETVIEHSEMLGAYLVIVVSSELGFTGGYIGIPFGHRFYEKDISLIQHSIPSSARIDYVGLPSMLQRLPLHGKFWFIGFFAGNDGSHYMYDKIRRVVDVIGRHDSHWRLTNA